MTHTELTTEDFREMQRALDKADVPEPHYYIYYNPMTDCYETFPLDNRIIPYTSGVNSTRFVHKEDRQMTDAKIDEVNKEIEALQEERKALSFIHEDRGEEVYVKFYFKRHYDESNDPDVGFFEMLFGPDKYDKGEKTLDVGVDIRELEGESIELTDKLMTKIEQGRGKALELAHRLRTLNKKSHALHELSRC